MKNINWLSIGLITAIIICFGFLVSAIIEHNTSDPLEPKIARQKTLEYVGFDGKKHQAIVLFTAQHNWVLVERK